MLVAGLLGVAVGGGALDQLRDRTLDRLVGGELGLGVEVELPVAPRERGDDSVITGGGVTCRVEQVAEQEVQGGCAAAVLAQRQRPRSPFSLGCLQ